MSDENYCWVKKIIVCPIAFIPKLNGDSILPTYNNGARTLYQGKLAHCSLNVIQHLTQVHHNSVPRE